LATKGSGGAERGGRPKAARPATRARAQQAVARRPATRRGGPEIERTEFTSGLRVLSESMPSVRSVTLGFWVTTGSRDERPSIGGASHFLEHLLFKGTQTRTARDIAESFDAVGGDFNAFTSKETTVFYARVLDKDLGLAVELLCDMLQSSVLDKKDFEGERQVILEEINMHEDTPDDLVHDLFAETLWSGHPLGRPVLGTVDSINGMSRDQVFRFYRRHYQPANLVVAAAGNVDHDALVAGLKNGMDTGRVLSRGRSAWSLRAAGRPPKPSGARLVKHRQTEQAHIMLGTNGLSRNDPERFAFGIVNAALGGGMSSRLFQEIREQRGLAYSVYSYHQMYAEAGIFAMYSGTTPGRAEEALSLLRGEAERMAEDGLKAEEFERAKGHVKGSMVLSLEETSGRMSRLGRSETGHGEILSIDEMLDRVERVSLADANAVAAKVLSRPMSLTVLGPFDDDAFGGSDPDALAEVAAHHPEG
jgi:predicted Zn-dependent peptidase